ncbi:unnamed protein product, partial [Callosobruchus maculatus]
YCVKQLALILYGIKCNTLHIYFNINLPNCTFAESHSKMKLQIALLSLLVYSFTPCDGFKSHLNPFNLQEVEYHGTDVGERLILTPLIEQGKLKEARAAATVTLGGAAKNVRSYAGYLTVNKLYNSNLYFWFFPSNGDHTRDPVVVWLQGGPGSPSMYGLLIEHGPFGINKDLKLELREHAWTNNHSVIYIDNPVGTGFSFTENDKGYARNQTQVGNELYEALQQFFKIFPELRKNDFFVTGESYGGKYVPALAYTIHKKNPHAKDKINLKGIAIGNGYTDPIHQTGYAAYVYELGLVDKETADTIDKLEKSAVDFISKGDLDKAGALWNQALRIIITHSKVNIYNYLQEGGVNDEDLMIKFLNGADLRRAIHVGNTTFGSNEVYRNLQEDMPRSIAPWFAEVANNYRVLLYSGQLDIIVAYPLTLNFLQNAEFEGIRQYREASRHIWYVDHEVAGYTKTGTNFTEVLVRNAGHMVPSDQPKWAEDLIYKFTRNKSIY